MILYADSRYISPYVFSAFVALKEKGLEFQVEELALDAGAARQPAYREKSVTARVPALEHDGFVLAESSAIVEYLDDAFAPPTWPRLLPEDVRRRARARQVMAFVRSDLLPLREERSTETMFFEDARATAPLGKAAQASADKLIYVAERLLDAGDLGGAFSMADADLAFMLHRLILNGDPVPDRVKTYAAGVWTRASLRAFVDRPRTR